MGIREALKDRKLTRELRRERKKLANEEIVLAETEGELYRAEEVSHARQTQEEAVQTRAAKDRSA